MAGTGKKRADEWFKEQRGKLGVPDDPNLPLRPLIAIEGEEIELTPEQLKGIAGNLLDCEHTRFYIGRQQKKYSSLRRGAIEVFNDSETNPRDKINALRLAMDVTIREDNLLLHEVMTPDVRHRKVDEEGLNGQVAHTTLIMPAIFIDKDGVPHLLSPSNAGGGDKQSSGVQDNAGQVEKEGQDE